MTGLVIDASVAVTWALQDENSSHADDLLERCKAEKTFVPPLFHTEVLNSMLMSERRGRITFDEVEVFLEILDSLRLKVRRWTWNEERQIYTLARTHRLTVYDAGYLYLASDQSIPIGTFDREIIHAAKVVGVPLL